jgi:hypothetical protein
LVPVASLGQYQLVPASNKPKSVPYNTSNSSVYQYTSLPVYTQITGQSNPTAYSIPAHKHTSTGTRQSTPAHKYTSTQVRVFRTPQSHKYWSQTEHTSTQVRVTQNTTIT